MNCSHRLRLVSKNHACMRSPQSPKSDDTAHLAGISLRDAVVEICIYNVKYVYLDIHIYKYVYISVDIIAPFMFNMILNRFL